MRGKLWFGVATAALLMFGLAPAASAQDADQPGDATTQARLDASAEGDISPATDTDWFRLRVETGQRYSLTLDGVGEEGQAIDPILVIYDAQGNQVAFNDDANNSLNSALQYTPSQSGEVFVEARGFSPEATGRYRLAVTSAPIPPDDTGNDASTNGRIRAGQTVTGNIEYEGDFDWYSLSTRTGQRYTISLSGTETNGLGDPTLRIIDAEGNELAMNDDSGEGGLNSRVDFIPRANGHVFVEARGYGDAYTGAYTLNVEASALPRDNTSGDTSTRGRISAGQTVNAGLDFPTDTDWYRIRLEEGQSYRFTLVGAGDAPLGDPLLQIYNAAGEQVAMDDDGGEGLNSYLEFTTPSTGNYFVEARAFGEEATGNYTLAARAGDIPADTSTDASLSAEGDYREGVLAPAGDRDWYRVDLTEGQAMRVGVISAEGADALGDPYIVLYGPDGAEIARDDDGGDGLNAALEHQAAAAGAHYIEVRGFSEDAAGRYVVSLMAGEIGNSAEGADYVQANGEGRVSFIGAPGDVDWFTIELIEGRPYRFVVEGMEPDALADPYLRLYDGQGAEIIADDDGGAGLNAYISFASPTGGPYFAAVSSFDEASTGRYQIRVADTEVPGNVYTDETLDPADDGRVSRIELPGDLDTYRVTLEAGVRYLIDVRGQGEYPLADPFLAVLNPEGTRITTDDDGGEGLDARLRFTPDTAGEYYIQASGLGGSTGSYQISIVRQ